MAFMHAVDTENRFVFTAIYDEIDDQTLVDHVLELEKKTADIPDFREMADCSEVTGFDALTVTGTAEAAMLETVHPNSRLAIVVTRDPAAYGIARAYQTLSMDKRKDTEIFFSCDEAMLWLSESPKDFERMKCFQNSALLTR